MAEKEKKKFKDEAIIIGNKVMKYEDVPLDNHAYLSKYIIHVVDGTMVVCVVGMLVST